MPINGKNVLATVTNEEISFKEAQNQSTTWGPKLPKYTPTNIDDDSLSNLQFKVDKNQDALKIDGVDFQFHPLKSDIPDELLEAMRYTAKTKFNATNVYIRLDLDRPTCYIFDVSKSNNDSTTPLEFNPKLTGSAHHHNKTTSPSTPTPKPKMPINNENLIRRYYQQLITRIIEEYEAEAKKLKDKLQKQRHAFETKLERQEKHYKDQLKLLQHQQKQPQLELPKKDQLLVNWVSTNWKYLEPTFKKYANALYTSHTERLHGGKDGKGDNYVADQYMKQAQEIMALQFEEFFKHTKQKSLNAQSNKDKHKSKDKELGK